MTEIYLIRHGKVDNPSGMFYGRSRDIPLSPTGHEQIEIVADRLAGLNVTPEKIVTSPLIRASQTASIIGKRYPNIDIVKDIRLLETYSSGFEGLSIPEVDSFDDFYKVNSGTYKGKRYKTEDPTKIVNRIMSLMLDLGKTTQTTFVVSHGDPIAFTLFRLQNPEAAFPNIKELRKQGLQQGEVAILKFSKGGTELTQVEKLMV